MNLYLVARAIRKNTKSICQQATEAIYIPRPPSAKSRRDASNECGHIFCVRFFKKLQTTTPELLDHSKCAQLHWMRLAETFPMVVSECKSRLRLVGKLIFCPVLLEVQSSCSNFRQNWANSHCSTVKAPPRAQQWPCTLLIFVRGNVSCILFAPFHWSDM